jgi:hypothetical protein
MLESQVDLTTSCLPKGFLGVVIGESGRITHMPVMQELQIFDIQLSLDNFGITWGFGGTQAAR